MMRKFQFSIEERFVLELKCYTYRDYECDWNNAFPADYAAYYSAYYVDYDYSEYYVDYAYSAYYSAYYADYAYTAY